MTNASTVDHATRCHCAPFVKLRDNRLTTRPARIYSRVLDWAHQQGSSLLFFEEFDFSTPFSRRDAIRTVLAGWILLTVEDSPVAVVVGGNSWSTASDTLTD